MSGWSRLARGLIGVTLLASLVQCTTASGDSRDDPAPTGATVTTGTPSTGPANAGGDRFLTILFGRSQWQPASKCSPITPAVTLEDAVSFLHTKGYPAVGGVTLNYASQSSRLCKGPVTYATWTELTRLRERYGFEAVSQSRTYDRWASLSSEAQYQNETCATLPELRNRGFNRAWGMFNYPNNVQSPLSQRVATSCFAFGRAYGNKTNFRSRITTSPYVARTMSVVGGKCGNASLPCSRINAPRYQKPESYAGLLSPSTDSYAVVQFYRFVSGSGSRPGLSWDCTSPSSDDHWTSMAEVYCFNDFQRAVEMIGGNVTVTDPATVAQRWGRVPKP